jgi:hypothetical protein
MRLFEIDSNYILKIDPIAYTLIPFKTLWDRDKSATKDIAKKELSYIYFKNDFKSDFYSEPDEEKRAVEVIKHIFGETKWTPDKKVLEAEEFYKDKQRTISSKLLEGALIYTGKIDNFFRNVNLELTDDNGRYLFNPKQGNDILKDLGKTIESLKQLQDIVKKEQEANNHLRGNRKKSMYTDG